MARILTLLFIALAAGLLAGCASEKEDDPTRVSTIPWNHPEGWESQGPLGGMMPQNNNYR